MEEEFYNIVEDIVKSEDMESDTTIQAILPDRYYSEISEECSELSELSESMPQSNDNISLSLRCRLCAIAYDDMVDVFSPNVKGHNIIEKIELCLCIMVRRALAMITSSSEMKYQLRYVIVIVSFTGKSVGHPTKTSLFFMLR